MLFFFFSSRRRHTRSLCDWSSDVCSSDLGLASAVTGWVAPDVRSATPGYRLGEPWYQVGIGGRIGLLTTPGGGPDSRRMRVRVLGPLEVNEGETGLGPRDRVVLEALAA